MNKRDAQREKRREEILFAGLELFVKNGYSSTKTSDIAKAVNMSDGLLFHYFATKETLYGDLIRIGMETSQEWIESSPDQPLAFFTGVAEQILRMIRESPISAKFFVLMAQAQRSGATPCEILELMEPQKNRYQKTLALIRAGQETGEIRAGNPDALAAAYWCSIQGIAEQLATHPETPLPEAEWIAAMLKNESRREGEVSDGEHR